MISRLPEEDRLRLACAALEVQRDEVRYEAARLRFDVLMENTCDRLEIPDGATVDYVTGEVHQPATQLQTVKQ